MVAYAAPPRKNKNIANAKAAAPAETATAAEPPVSYQVAPTASLPDIFAQRLNLVLDNARFPASISKRCTNVAYDFDLSAAAVRKWLVGEGLPSPAMMKRLAQHFNISLDFLMGLSEEPLRKSP